MRQRYARFVELSNQGAREMGFKDTGALWRAGYDMSPKNSAPPPSACGSSYARSICRYTRMCAPSS